MKFTEEEIQVAMIMHERRRQEKHKNNLFLTVPLDPLGRDQLRLEALADLTEKDEMVIHREKI